MWIIRRPPMFSGEERLKGVRNRDYGNRGVVREINDNADVCVDLVRASQSSQLRTGGSKMMSRMRKIQDTLSDFLRWVCVQR